jgi:hypothetical protein
MHSTPMSYFARTYGRTTVHQPTLCNRCATVSIDRAQRDSCRDGSDGVSARGAGTARAILVTEGFFKCRDTVTHRES